MLNQSKIFAFGSAGIAFLGLIFIITSPGSEIIKLIGAILTFLGSIGSIIFYKYGYIAVPLLTQQARIVVVTDTGYEIPPTQDAIIKKGSNNLYYASVFLGLKVFESTTEKTQEENILYSEYFERAISNFKYVTKISYLLYVEDVTEKRKIIEAKRAEAQLRLAREKEKPEPDVLKIDRYEREVAKWDNELQKILKGVKPMGIVAYAMTTAVGVTKEAALAAARAQANEIKAVLTNALNVDIEVLTGDQMLRAFEWEKTIPTTPQELEESIS